MMELHRTRLRPFVATDAAFLADARNDLVVEAASQSTAPRPTSAAIFGRRIEAGHPAPSSGGDDDLEFVVTRMDDPEGTPLGIAGLYELDQFNRNAELGVAIADPDGRGEGLGIDCYGILAVYAFRTLGLNKVYASIKSSNETALGTARRLGMEPHGVLPEQRWHEGQFVDLHVFGMLASQWNDALLQWRAPVPSN